MTVGNVGRVLKGCANLKSKKSCFSTHRRLKLDLWVENKRKIKSFLLPTEAQMGEMGRKMKSFRAKYV